MSRTRSKTLQSAHSRSFRKNAEGMRISRRRVFVAASHPRKHHNLDDDAKQPTSICWRGDELELNLPENFGPIKPEHILLNLAYVRCSWWPLVGKKKSVGLAYSSYFDSSFLAAMWQAKARQGETRREETRIHFFSLYRLDLNKPNLKKSQIETK